MSIINKNKVIYKNSIPLMITNQNCLLVTLENYSSYTTKDNVGKFYYEYPFPFYEGKTYPKMILIDNLAVFDNDGKELMGYSVHCGFNTETFELDQCIGFITYIHKKTKWKITKSNRGTLIWFKEPSGTKIIQPFKFVIVGRLYF